MPAALSSPHRSIPTSECSIHSDTPPTEAEAMETNDSLKRVSSWRTATSTELSQGRQCGKTVDSHEDIDKYTWEPHRLVSTVDLNLEGSLADYYPSHLVKAALKKI